MSVKNELELAAKKLQPKKIKCKADKNLGNLEAEILLAHILKKDRAWLRAHEDLSLTDTQSKQFQKLVQRRKKHEPIAYLIGHKDFYGLQIKVNSNVLIPRPASETIVDLVKGVKTKIAPIVLDIGTGSGAISLAIAKSLPKSKVLATDISSAALNLARVNAKALKIKNISFQKSDLLSPVIVQKLKQEHRPLIVTANLPYLPTSDKKKLEPDVVQFEPHNALFSGKEGNDLITAFLSQLKDLEINFKVAFIEFDAPQAKALKTLAEKLFPNTKIKIHKDLEANDRVLEIRA